MYNWSTDEKMIKKDKEKYAVWRLEQMINFGLNGEKLNETEVRKYRSKLQLDPSRAKFIDFLLHENHSHQTTNRRTQNRRKRS